jgi:hypothetical protein
MKRLTTICLTAAAVCVVGSATAVSAGAALPAVLFLPGVTSAVLSGSGTTAAVHLFGVKNVVAKGYVFELHIKENMASSGTAKIEITNAELEEGGRKCTTPGAGTGIIILEGEWHAVLALGGASNLFLLLLLIKEATFVCSPPSLSIKVKGSALFDALPFNKEILTSESLEIETGKCVGNRPAYKEYINDAGTMVSAKLESNFGLGFEESCLELAGKVKLTPSEMMEVMEP